MEQTKFEDKLKRLDDIVNAMSQKTLSLEESLALYEEGNKIITELSKTLEEAESKVEKIIESK
ncbi:MAG: exodeoxyribonuclease VII small subunit [Bacilli bacterium]|nr:exodeoxyribonuclease VII small subunit [Bacilli bacterium]